MSQLGKRVKKIRKLAGVSQLVFARGLGIDRTHISKIETGKAVPSQQLIKSMCQHWVVSEEWLREGKGPIEKQESMTPKEVHELYLKIREIGYKSYKNLLQRIINIIESLEKTWPPFTEKDKRGILTELKEFPEEKQRDFWKLQKNLSVKLDKIRARLLLCETSLSVTDIERSAITILRAIDSESLKDFCLLLAFKAGRLDESQRKKLRNHILALKKAGR